MTSYDLATYFTTLVAISLAPGPISLMLIVRAASKDAAGALSFAFGSAVGGVLIIAVVCLGLTNWLAVPSGVFAYSKYALMAYILWLAWGIWQGGVDMSAKPETRSRGILGSMLAGFAANGISPYMMILFPLVLPEIVEVTSLNLTEIGTISATTFLAFFLCDCGVIAFAVQLGKLMQSPKYATLVNRSLSLLLVGGGGFMALG